MADEEMMSGALGGLFSAGMSMATGNPIGAAMAIGGLGLSLFGGASKAATAKEMAGVQTKMTQIEMQQDAARQQMMRVSARRQQMEILRNQQRARSLALSASTSQGAQLGSGLSGGYGQISGQTGVNALGVSQALQAGEEMFGLNQQLGQQKIKMAQLGGQAATADAYSKAGGTLMGSAQTGSNLFKHFSQSTQFGPGNAQPYGGGMNELY